MTDSLKLAILIGGASIALVHGLILAFAPRLFRAILQYYPKAWAAEVSALSDGRLRFLGAGTAMIGAGGLRACLATHLSPTHSMIDTLFWVGLISSGIIAVGLVLKPLPTMRVMEWEAGIRRMGGTEDQIVKKLRFIGIACLAGVFYVGYTALNHQR